MPQLTASEVQVYRFLVDGKLYESKEQLVTGEQLRAIVGIRPRLRIFLGDHHPGASDQQITKTTVVDLATLGERQFYTLAPPSYDIF